MKSKSKTPMKKKITSFQPPRGSKKAFKESKTKTKPSKTDLQASQPKEPALKAEILAPAGNREALQAAFAAGADAVYFGLPLFGARAFAKNFTLEEAKDIIAQAHLADKKIYVTMNTLLEEDQMEKAYEWAKALHEMGVDALIIQDLGLIHLLHHRLPNLELHASTQLSVTTPYQIEQLAKLGISRVVLAREATLEQIEACAKTGMELEAFVHGALCISYSGQCRFSQVRYNRSGNKGACAQPCRMEYVLEENGIPLESDGNFLLSPKDLSLVQEVADLVKAGVWSLKIEGRMKSPEYVFESVQATRKGLNHEALSEEDLENMETTFHRGYTKGHTFEKRGRDLMNPKSSNHQGVRIGTVIGGSKDKVRIRLEKELNQGDGLRFGTSSEAPGGMANFIFDARGKLISKGQAGQEVEIKCATYVTPGMEVRKTSSARLQKKVEEAIRITKIQAPISMHLQANTIGSPLLLSASDGKQSVTVQGEAVQEAKTAPTTLEQIERSLQKTGNTWAKVEHISVDLPQNAFLPAKVLNDLRREVLEKLEAQKKEHQAILEIPYSFAPTKPEPLPNIVEIQQKQQSLDDGLLQVSEFPLANTTPKANLTHDHGLFTDHLGQGRIVESMNITNSYALAALLELGYQGAVLSGELSEQGRKDLLKQFEARYGFKAPVMMTVYEKPRLMVMNHCPVNTLKKDGQRQNCSLCRTNQYTLKGKDGKRAILYGNVDCQMQLFDETPQDRLEDIPSLKQEGIEAFRFVLTNEDATQSQVIRHTFQDIASKTSG